MRYCEGLPEAGVRPLRAEERDAVLRLRRGLGRRLALRLALVPAGPAAAMALVVAGFALFESATEGAAGAALRALAVGAFLGGFLVAPAAALLHARDRWREWRRVGSDAAAGVAAEFAAGARALTVLPASGRVLARDGRPAGLGERAEIGAAAAAPAEAPTYAVTAVGDAREIAAQGLVRRPLSPEEREELRAHARGLRRIPRALWLLVAWWLLGAVQWSRGAERGSPLAAALTLVLAHGLWRLHRARSLAARLEADAEEGWAIRATAGATTGQEALPASRAAWTSGGVPARWRVGAGR